jgi:hypothetical protein
MPFIIRAWAKVNNHLGLLVAVLAGLALKAALLAARALPFNADEAVVALMARHIRLGERPLYFYGQAYMGSLDAYLVAGGFTLFGEHVWVIRAIQTALYTLTLILVYLFVLRAFKTRRTAAIAALLMALPSVNQTLYTTVSLGGYGEALLIGALTMWLCLPPASGRVGPLRGLLLGLLMGLGVWVFPLSLTMSLPAVITLAWFVRRTMRARDLMSVGGIAAVGLLLGIRPWVTSYALLGRSAVSELFGGAIAGSGAATAWSAFGPRLANLALFGSTVVAGIRPPWAITWLFWPLAPLAIAFLLGTIAYAILKLRENSQAAPARRIRPRRLAGSSSALRGDPSAVTHRWAVLTRQASGGVAGAAGRGVSSTASLLFSMARHSMCAQSARADDAVRPGGSSGYARAARAHRLPARRGRDARLHQLLGRVSAGLSL